MKTRIVRIGNSQDIRIPMPLFESAGLQGEVDLSSRSGGLLIRPTRSTRASWAQAFQEMAKHGDAYLLADIPPESVRLRRGEWEWQPKRLFKCPSDAADVY